MTADQHYINLYKTMMLQIRRSVVRGGVVVNAKPIFILALIEDIRRGTQTPNVFYYDESLSAIYRDIWKEYYPNVSPTPLFKPFYHLANDGFWNIKWKAGKVRQPQIERLETMPYLAIWTTPFGMCYRLRRRDNTLKIKSFHISYLTRNRKQYTIWQLSILTSLR